MSNKKTKPKKKKAISFLRACILGFLAGILLLVGCIGILTAQGAEAQPTATPGPEQEPGGPVYLPFMVKLWAWVNLPPLPTPAPVDWRQ